MCEHISRAVTAHTGSSLSKQNGKLFVDVVWYNNIRMIVEINNSQRIADIKDAFHAAYPFLQLEFFSRPHEWGKPSSITSRIGEDKLIAEIRTVQGVAAMEIHSWHTTGLVEQEFGKIFGLYIQVFRRDGSDWVQTAGTDTRTLEEQNEAGRNASQELMDGTNHSFNRENPA